MNQPKVPDPENRSLEFQFSLRSVLIAVSLLAVGVALVTLNVAAYQHTRLMEYQYRRSVTEVRPWIWPEGALALFMLAWALILIASTVSVFRLRNRILKYGAVFFAVAALVALAVNAICWLREAFTF